MQDDIDAAANPSCPECGTALVDVARGYVCRNCQLAFVLNFQNNAAKPQAPEG